LPRDLEDVLDYLLPAPGNGATAGSTSASGPLRPDHPRRPAALPILALPIGSRDVVRAAFAWNLTVEIARLGASADLVAPRADGGALWPDPGRGPIGAELSITDADGLGALSRAAFDVAVSRAAEANDGGVVLVCVPPAWLSDANDGRALLRWVLLFSSPETTDLKQAYGLAKHVRQLGSEARVGLTIHGARRVGEAERAFERVAVTAQRHLSLSVVSYGLLVDDLHVYRAIAARRPIGLERPQSRASRALGDVAGLILEDARKRIGDR
jgi:hypothetical protein